MPGQDSHIPAAYCAGCGVAWPTWREVLAEEHAPRTSLNRHPVGRHRRLALVHGRLDTAK